MGSWMSDKGERERGRGGGSEGVKERAGQGEGRGWAQGGGGMRLGRTARKEGRCQLLIYGQANIYGEAVNIRTRQAMQVLAVCACN